MLHFQYVKRILRTHTDPSALAPHTNYEVMFNCTNGINQVFVHYKMLLHQVGSRYIGVTIIASDVNLRGILRCSSQISEVSSSDLCQPRDFQTV